MKIITKVVFFLILFTLSKSLGLAQPRDDWTKLYHLDGDETLWDIYAATNERYLICGEAHPFDQARYVSYNYLVGLLDADGDPIWLRSFGMRDRGESGQCCIEADNGDFLIGGVGNIGDNGQNRTTACLRVSEEGNIVWSRLYSTGTITAIIELKAGDFLLVGRSQGQGYLLRITGEGEVVFENWYDVDEGHSFTSMRETEGGVVIAGNCGQTDIWLIKVNVNGDLLWSNSYHFDESQNCNSIISSGDGGFALTGSVANNVGQGNESEMDQYLMKVDRNGESLWFRRFDWDEGVGRFEESWSVTRLAEGGFAIAGYIESPEQYVHLPTVICTNRSGIERWRRIYPIHEWEGYGNDRNLFFSAIRGHDNSILAAGVATYLQDSTFQNGLVIKLEPENLQPRFTWSPYDTFFTVLIEDSVEFWISARLEDGNTPDEYIWVIGTDTLSQDSSLIYQFEQYGDTTVNCNVMFDEQVFSLIWHITVTDLYVSAFTPDTLDLTLHRGASVDFSLDTIRFTDGDEPEILWTKTNLSNGQAENSGDDAQATISFPWSGDYEIEGRVSRGESNDAVIWSVAVRSAIWAFVPQADSLEVLADSVVHFEVVPSAPEDERLSIQWFVDGEIVREGEVALDWAFGTVDSTVDNCRRYLVRCVVADSVEGDTVEWVVEVRDLGAGDNKEVGQAGTPVRLSVSPNPFNSTLMIRYLQSPHAIAGEVGGVSLSVYDIAGREVYSTVSPSRLTVEDATATHGGAAVERSVVWDASAVPAGVYFVRMQAGREVATKKVVLMR